MTACLKSNECSAETEKMGKDQAKKRLSIFYVRESVSVNAKE